MRRKISKQKEALALIEEALSCRSFCANNPAWVENALRLLGSDYSPQTLNEKTGKFEIEFSFRGWQVEIWSHPSRGFTYRRTTAKGTLAIPSKWKSCTIFFPTAKEAAEQAKSEVEFGEA